MTQQKNLSSSAQTQAPEAADLNTLFGGESREEFKASTIRSDPALQNIAQEIAPKLQELLALLDNGNCTSLRPRATMFLAAVNQVAAGRAGYLNFGIVSAVDTFQSETLSSLSKWSSFTCYPDVIEHRNRLGQIAKDYFPVLNRILELVDYQALEEKK